jgi:hypothetical protein
MMTLVKSAALAAALAAAAPAAAQQQSQAAPQGGKLGIGLGLSTSGSANTAQLVFVPINALPNLRIEPFLGWARADVDAAPAGSGGSLFTPGSGKSSDFSLGVGGFWVAPVVAQVQLYAGGRLALQWESFKNTAGAKWERTNFLLAPTFGTEWIPHPRVAIGAEFMLGLLWYGDTDFPNGTSGAGGTGSFTQGTLFARFYLF